MVIGLLGTSYAVRDLVKDTSTNNIFFCNTAHTSKDHNH